MSYGNLALQGKRWVMTNIPPHVSIRLKHIFPRLPKTQVAPFEFPDDPMHCADLAWFESRYTMRMSDGDRQALTSGRELFERTRADMGALQAPDYVPPPFALLRDGQEIRIYQAQAIDLAYMRQSLLCGDDLGLGKSYVGIGLMLRPGCLPGAIVAQAHLQHQWRKKIEEFSKLRVHEIKLTKPYPLPPADVYVFKYSQLLGWTDFFDTGFFRAVAFDEIKD